MVFVSAAAVTALAGPGTTTGPDAPLGPGTATTGTPSGATTGATSGATSGTPSSAGASSSDEAGPRVVTLADAGYDHSLEEFKPHLLPTVLGPDANLTFSQKLTRVLICVIGLGLGFDFENPGVFDELPNGEKPVKVKGAREALAFEIERRVVLQQLKKPAFAGWTKKKRLAFLNEHAIKCPWDIAYLKKELGMLQDIAKGVVASMKATDDKHMWTDIVPWLRLIMCFTDPEVQKAYMERHLQPHRTQVEAKVSNFKNCMNLIMKKFNSDEVFVAKAKPDLHDDFIRDIMIPLTAHAPIDEKQVKARLDDMRVGFLKVKGKWEASGNGKFMSAQAMEDHGEQKTEEEVYQFVDGDDRQAFLGPFKSHILYWWAMSYELGLMESATETFPESIKAEGDQVMVTTSKVASSSKKKEESSKILHKEIVGIKRCLEMNAERGHLNSIASASHQAHELECSLSRCQEKAANLELVLISMAIPDHELHKVMDDDEAKVKVLKLRLQNEHNRARKIKIDLAAQDRMVQYHKDQYEDFRQSHVPPKRSKDDVDDNVGDDNVDIVACFRRIWEPPVLSDSDSSDDRAFAKECEDPRKKKK